MRYRFNRGYRYGLTNPPKALLKTRLDNIAIVPGQYVGDEGALANGGKYIAPGWRAVNVTRSITRDRGNCLSG